MEVLFVTMHTGNFDRNDFRVEIWRAMNCQKLAQSQGECMNVADRFEKRTLKKSLCV